MSEYDMNSFIADFAERTEENLKTINYLAKNGNLLETINLLAKSDYYQEIIDRLEKSHGYEDLVKKDSYKAMQVFEVTQLINSFLGLIILPNEKFKYWRYKIQIGENGKKLRRSRDIDKIVGKVQIVLDHCRDEGRYVNSFEKPENIFRFCDHLRNCAAHNGVLFSPLQWGAVIEKIYFYECSKGKDKEFCLKLNTKNDKELCSKLNIEEDNEVHILAGCIAELYKHIEILEGQNTEYEKRVKELDDLLSPDQTSTEGTVAE